MAKIKLKPEAVEMIERMLSSGKDVKIKTSNNGLVIYSEEVKKIYAQPQAGG